MEVIPKLLPITHGHITVYLIPRAQVTVDALFDHNRLDGSEPKDRPGC